MGALGDLTELTGWPLLPVEGDCLRTLRTSSLVTIHFSSFITFEQQLDMELQHLLPPNLVP